MKKLRLYTYLLVGLALVVVQGVQLYCAAAAAPALPFITAKLAYEYGNKEGYSDGEQRGQAQGRKDYQQRRSVETQERSPALTVINARVSERTSPEEMLGLEDFYHVRFDAEAQGAFAQGYREGFANGWTDGHQVGYAQASQPPPTPIEPAPQEMPEFAPAPTLEQMRAALTPAQIREAAAFFGEEDPALGAAIAQGMGDEDEVDWSQYNHAPPDL